jgi:hypothetical protein
LIIEFNVKAQIYCDFITKVQSYQDSVKLIERKNDEVKPVEVDPTSFDTNTYMKLFNKLSLPTGLECHLYSNYNRDSGTPSLYVRAKTFNEKEYINRKLVQYSIFIDSFISNKIHEFKKDNLSEEKVSHMIKYLEYQKKCLNRDNAIAGFAMDSLNKACNNLIPEDSKAGYLQYLFFHQFGEQFALFWHANYGNKSLICSKKDIEYFLDYYCRQSADYDCEENKIVELLNLDLSPIIEMSSKECLITWYEIETHNGIYKRCYRIERHSPFRIGNVADEKNRQYIS